MINWFVFLWLLFHWFCPFGVVCLLLLLHFMYYFVLIWLFKNLIIISFAQWISIFLFSKKEHTFLFLLHSNSEFRFDLVCVCLRMIFCLIYNYLIWFIFPSFFICHLINIPWKFYIFHIFHNSCTVAILFAPFSCLFSFILTQDKTSWDSSVWFQMETPTVFECDTFSPPFLKIPKKEKFSLIRCSVEQITNMNDQRFLIWAVYSHKYRINCTFCRYSDWISIHVTFFCSTIFYRFGDWLSSTPHRN